MGEIVQLSEKTSSRFHEDKYSEHFSKECWQEMKSRGIAEKPATNRKSQDLLDFCSDDPLMASSIFPSIRPKIKHEAKSGDPKEAPNNQHPVQETHFKQQERQSNRECKPKQPAKPEQHLPEIHLDPRKSQEHHSESHKSRNQQAGNDNEKPSEQGKGELEPGMILGGAGGAPPPGDGHVNSDPDYCTVEEWFKNTVTVVNSEGKDPQSPDKTGSSEIESEKKPERKTYTPEEIEQIIAKFEYEHERETAKYLLEHGEEVDKNPNEGQPGQGDAIVNGKNTEFKYVSEVVDQTEKGLSRAIASRAMDARSQAPHVIVNVSKQAGMTQEIAEHGISRAYGADTKAGAKIQSIRVIGKNFDQTEQRK